MHEASESSQGQQGDRAEGEEVGIKPAGMQAIKMAGLYSITGWGPQNITPQDTPVSTVSRYRSGSKRTAARERVGRCGLGNRGLLTVLFVCFADWLLCVLYLPPVHSSAGQMVRTCSVTFTVTPAVVK